MLRRVDFLLARQHVRVVGARDSSSQPIVYHLRLIIALHGSAILDLILGEGFCTAGLAQLIILNAHLSSLSVLHDALIQYGGTHLKVLRQL